MTMDAKPLVSVIIPLYNCEKYLPEALDSLVAQTVPDWEAILVGRLLRGRLRGDG